MTSRLFAQRALDQRPSFVMEGEHNLVFEEAMHILIGHRHLVSLGYAKAAVQLLLIEEDGTKHIYGAI